MPINYNLKARHSLKKLLAEENKDYTSRSLYQAVELVLKDYDENPELSSVARSNFFNNLSNKLSDFYDNQVYPQKSFWEKILYFLGWLPDDELYLRTLIKQTKKRSYENQTVYNSLSFFQQIVRSIIPAIMSIGLNTQDKSIIRKLRHLSHRSLTTVSGIPHELEGNLSVFAYKDYISDLQAFIDSFPLPNDEMIHRVQKLIHQLECCEHYETDLLRHQNELVYLKKWGQLNQYREMEEEYVHDKTFDILNTIINLKKGDSALFNHGYIACAGGHASVFEVEKIDEDKVVFRFINTGSSVFNVASWATLFKGIFVGFNQSPIKVTSPITIETLTSSDLIAKLLRPKIVEAQDSQTGKELMIAPLLELYQMGNLHDDSSDISHQTMGSCSQSCIDAWLATQLNEMELKQFYFHRQQATLVKIEDLLDSFSLDAEQNNYCEHMRMGIKVELALLKDQLEQDESDAIKLLMRTREENTKHKTPKLPLDNVVSYCAEKLLPQRIMSKFTSKDLALIAEGTLPIVINERKTECSASNRISLGIFGTKSKVALSKGERIRNKVNKVLLAKKIMSGQQLLEQVVKTSRCTEDEQKRISLLVELRKQKKAVYYSELCLLEPEQSHLQIKSM